MEVLIKQFIEFEFRYLNPLVVRVILILVIFMTKQKSPRQIFKWTIIQLKILQRQCILFTQLDQVTHKI